MIASVPLAGTLARNEGTKVKSRLVLLMIVAVAMTVAVAATQGQPVLAGALDGVTPPAPAVVVVGGSTTIVVSFHDDAGASVMTAAVGAPNNSIFTGATVALACSASTTGMNTGNVSLNDVFCDANTTSESLTWTLTLTCTAANPSASPTTPITVAGAPSASGLGSIYGPGDLQG